MKLCIFEDEKYENLYPLTLIHPVFELKCGYTFLYEKIIRKFSNLPVCYFVRDYFVEWLKKKFGNVPINDLQFLKGDDILLINGRLVFMEGDCPSFLKKNGTVPVAEEIGIDKETIVYAKVNKKTIEECIRDCSSFSGREGTVSEQGLPAYLAIFLKNIKEKVKNQKNIQTTIINCHWDLIKYNPDAIKDDFKYLKETGIKGEFSKNSDIVGNNDLVYVAKEAEVQPQVVVDTKHGPVIIDSGAIVYPFSRIEGPTCIGSKTLVVGGKIREGSAIGVECRVGGEVEESIMHGYANKWHDGFLGHSYVGEWVNLGAATQNSDVKNDYSDVQMYVNNELMDSGMWKLGCMIGDHTKTSIGTLINTGSVIGIMSNVVGSGGNLPKFIPSFCWFLNGKPTKGYGFNWMVDTAKKVLPKRGKELTEDDISLLKKAYEITKPKRDELIKKSRMEFKTEV